MTMCVCVCSRTASSNHKVMNFISYFTRVEEFSCVFHHGVSGSATVARLSLFSVIFGVLELISVVDGLHFNSFSSEEDSTTSEKNNKKNKEEYMNDARGQRLFSTSVFNVRPFFFWAVFLFFNNIFFFSILRISFRLLYATVFFHTADGFSSSPSSCRSFPFVKFLLCARTMRCFVFFLRCVTKSWYFFSTKKSERRGNICRHIFRCLQENVMALLFL